MKWPSIKRILSRCTPLKGYQLDQLSRREVPSLVRQLRRWYPAIRAGSESSHLQPTFYYENTCLKGENVERSIYPFVLKFKEEIVTIFTLKKMTAARAITGALGAVHPSHRGHGIANWMVGIGVVIAKLMKADIVYFYATLQHSLSQKAHEKNGLRIVGIIPAFDLDYFSKGKSVKRVAEAIYARVLCSSKKLAKPRLNSMTPSARKMWQFIFNE